MKQFQAAVAVAEKEAQQDQTWQFEVTGPREGDVRVLTAHMATPAQIAVALSQIGRHTSISTKIAGVIDFFMAIMEEEDVSYLTERLMNRNDPFEIDQVTDIMFWLIEEWGGHPTQGPSGSSSSPKSGGPTSTPPGLTTPSDSPSTDS